MTTDFKPSKYQQNVFDWVEHGHGHAVIQAVAGSGKTTTIVKALSFIPASKRVLFLAFNKSIANELKNRVPSHVDAQTLNSCGFTAWLGHCRKARIKTAVDPDKLAKIAYAYRDQLDALASVSTDDATAARLAFVREYLYDILNLARKAKIAGLAPEGVKGIKGLMADTTENWQSLIEHYDIEFDIDRPEMDAVAVAAARHIVKVSVANLVEIDFDDQFYMPILYEAQFTLRSGLKPDFICVDEAQDVSDIQREILRRLMGTQTRLIAVGDHRQAIYGFRGSNPESLGLVQKDFQAVQLPLNVCYRCPKAVVELAKTLVPELEVSETAPQGIVKDLGTEWRAEDFQADDMVICRNTAPLVGLAYALLSQRIPCQLRGRDLGAGLANLVEKLKARTMPSLLKKLDDWHRREVAKLTAKNPDANTQNVDDRHETLVTLITSTTVKSPEALVAEIKSMFSDDRGGRCLTLSTIHKAKGMEANRVFILNKKLMPSKYARQDWEIAQETNLAYVAYTRAKQELYFIDRV